MTEEFKALINNSITDENADKNKYEHMADMAEQEGMDCAHRIFHDIAHEEGTHIELLRHILEKGK